MSSVTMKLFPLSLFSRRLFPGMLLIGMLVFLSGCEKAEEVEEKKAETPSIQPAAPGTKRHLNPGEQKLVVDEIMRVRARQQAEGLGGGKVTVNGAWIYSGYSHLSPDPNAAIEARLVAVDITVTGHTENFDIDDIEIVDGASLMSYGSDPHATPLSLDGSTLSEGEFPAAPPKENRWLLIYGFPVNSPTFLLYYWGKELISKPLGIAERGMELPYPKAE